MFDMSTVKYGNIYFVLISKLKHVFSYTIAQIYIKRKFNIQTLNANRLLEDKSFILTSNHRLALDPLLLTTKLRIKDFRLVTKTKIINRKYGIKNLIFKFISTIFVSEGNSEINKIAKEDILLSLDTNSIVMLFSEGTRSKENFKSGDFKFGAVTLAKKSGKPIMPMAIYFDSENNRVITNLGFAMFLRPEDDVCMKNAEL